MSAVRVLLVGTILWALAFLLSALVFRGRALGDWIEGLLLVVWIAVFQYWAARSSRTRS
jgi:hypothetical protein